MSVIEGKVLNLLKIKRPMDAARLLSPNKLEHLGLVRIIINYLEASKESSKAADLMIRFGLTSEDFPSIHNRLLKKAMRYILNNHDWSFAVELHKDNPQILAWMVEDLVFSSKFSEANTLLHMHPECIPFIVKEDTLPALENQKNAAKAAVRLLPYSIITSDSFGTCSYAHP